MGSSGQKIVEAEDAVDNMERNIANPATRKPSLEICTFMYIRGREAYTDDG